MVYQVNLCQYFNWLCYMSLYNMYMILYLMYSRVFKNMLKLRYRVRGRTTQENSRHPSSEILIFKIATLLSLTYNLIYVNVHIIPCD